MTCRVLPFVCAWSAFAASLACAEALVYPNGARNSGELAGVVGGVWGPLATGTDAVFLNPAGLAAERGTSASAGSDIVRHHTATAGGDRSTWVDAAPGHLAWASGPARRGEAVPVGWGLFAHWPQDQDSSLSGTERSTTGVDAVPSQIDTGGLDAFSDGMARGERRASEGRYTVLAAGAGMGAEFAPGWRLGAGVTLERVRYLAFSTRLVTFDAESEDGSTYQANIQEESRVEGVNDRWAPVFGVQAKPAAGLVLSATARLPSRTLGGEGSVSYSRGSRATLNGSSGTVSLDELVAADAQGRDFELRTPLEVTLTAGLASSQYALLLEVNRVDGQPAYTAIAAPDSEPPSTATFRHPGYRTGSRPLTRWALGMTYAGSDSVAYGIGFRDDSSAVYGDDPVFREVNLYTISTGAVLRTGVAAFALGVLYQFAPRQSVAFPSPLGDERVTRSVQLETLTLRLGVTWIL